MDTSSASTTQVTMRSSETKAKRPTVRPNSIAFSSYPRFDLSSGLSSTSTQGSESVGRKSRAATSPSSLQLPSTAPIVPTLAAPVATAPEPGSPSSVTPLSQKTNQTRSSSACRADQEDKSPKNGSGGPGVQMRHSTSTPGNMSNTRNLEQGRKSRSMEDILNSPDEEPATTDCGCIGNFGRTKGRNRTMNAAELFSQPVALDTMRCRGPSDSHQSSSSISSSGSHNSLHGSLEIIQVSWWLPSCLSPRSTT